MLYGVSYYPEQKDKDELQRDLTLIKESGINTVRMGEFAWSRLEPEEGRFVPDWLDEVVETLGQAGIRTIICTPTACPPAWLVTGCPEIRYQDNRGVVRPFGGRRHYCYNNDRYREACARIARRLGEHYGKNPYVAGFQIDNEPAQEGTGRCTCPVCRNKFSLWLEKKYGTIETFNQRSGSVFWSQEYQSFDQITPPVNTIEPGAQNLINAFYENPLVRLDFERFSSDSQIAFQNIQTAVLREYTDHPVTTNATGLATNSIDYYKSTKVLDCYAFDYYPGLRNARVDSFPYAFARGVKEGAPFWVLEFMSGGGHRLSGSGRLQPNPGALKQAVVQAFAHGAQALLHFQYRTFPYGAEQLNYAIVDMDGIPRRRYREMKETAALLQKLEPLEQAAFPSQAGILLDYDTHWALRIKPVNDPCFTYLDYAKKLYHSLERIGINADVLSLHADWETYKVLLLPAAFLLDAAAINRLRAYVKKGGILIATFLTGVKNEDNAGYTQPLPAGLTDVFGICVEEVEPVFEENHTTYTLTLPGKQEDGEEQPENGGGVLTVKDGLWSELLSGTGKALGVYREDYKQGSMVISENQYGAGKAYYVGTDMPEETWQRFLRAVCSRVCPLPGRIAVPDGVECVVRFLKGRRVYFLFNFAGTDRKITGCRGYRNYITQMPAADEEEMSKNGFLILEEEKHG